MRALFLIPLVLLACKGGKDDDTDPVDCNAETTAPLSSIAVPDWPSGMAEAVQAYEGLSGIWTASACGTEVRVTITTLPDSGSGVEVVQTGLPAGHPCGCTHDPNNPDDGNLTVIGYSSIDVGVQDYPHEGFREENAGNGPDVTVALFNGASGLRVRACATHLVPPILGLDVTDTLLTITNGDNGMGGNVELTGSGVPSDSCALTGWNRVADAPD